MPLSVEQQSSATEATHAPKRTIDQVASTTARPAGPPTKIRRTHRVRVAENAVAQLLKSTTLWDVVKVQHGGNAVTPDRGDDLLVFYHHDTVEHALKKLAERKADAAPVLLGAGLGDGTGEIEDDFGTFMGMIDTHNLLRGFISTLRDPRRALKGSDQDRWQELDAVSEEFLKSRLITVCDDRDVTEMFRGGMDTTIHEALTRGFLSGGDQPHRICLFNLRGHVVGLVTQSDVIAFLYHNVDKLGDIAQQRVRDLPGFLKPVSIVEEDIATIDAFERMYQREVTGLAVIDGDTGKLVSSVSAGDLRGLRTFRSRELGLPVREFLRIQTEREEGGSSTTTTSESDKPANKMRHHVHTVTMEATLRDVLRLLSSEQVPRVYIVDIKGHAVGVATHTDVLHALEVLEVL